MSIRIGIFSDLHLEFRPSNVDKLIEIVKREAVDILINAGDTHPIYEERRAFNLAMPDNYFEVLGNHDFYGDYLYAHRWMDSVGTNRIAGATLWTNFNSNSISCRHRFPHVMVDARMIKPDKGASPSLTDQILKIHNEDISFLGSAKPDIVVTHHAPSYKSIHPIYQKYGEDNYYFCSDLEHFISNNPSIKLWIHGHVHTPFDYTIGDCRVVCHPLGYPGETHKTDDDYTLKIVEL